MRSFLEKRDPWGHGAALWIFAAMVFSVPLAWIACRGLRLENDVRDWLPADDPASQTLAWYEGRFPGDDGILVTWDGSTLDDPRIERLATRLRGHIDADGQRRGSSPFIQDVLTPGDAVRQMTGQGVEPAAAVRSLHGVLVGTGPLKVRLTAAGAENPERTRRQLAAAAKSELGLALRFLDPVETWSDEESQAAATRTLLDVPPHDLQISWQGLQPQGDVTQKLIDLALSLHDFPTVDEPDGRRLIDECFFSAGAPVGLTVTLSESGMAEPARALADLRSAAAAVGVGDDQLHLAGRSVAATELTGQVRRAVWNPAAPWYRLSQRSVLLLATLVSVACTLVFVRNLGVGVIVASTAAYATLLGVALVPLTGQPLNMVLIAMPVLLMVLALSGAIHVVNYWRHAAVDGPEAAVPRAMSMARPACLIATTAITLGMLGLAYSHRIPVRQFGLYTAAGSLIGLGLLLYGLPAVLQVAGLRPCLPAEASHRRWAGWTTLLSRRPGLVALSCLLVFVAGAAGLSRFQTETKVVRNFDESTRLIRDYRAIEEHLSGVTPIDVVVRFSPDAQQKVRFLERLEIVRAAEREVRSHGAISGAVSLADSLPAQTLPASDARRLERNQFVRRSNEMERQFKEQPVEGTAAYLQTVDAALEPHPDADRTLDRAGDELWRISARAALMSDDDYGALVRQLNARLQSVTRGYAGVDHVTVGTAPLFHETQAAVIKSLSKTFVLASVLIGMMLVWMLRTPTAALLAMLPNVLPIAFVFGVASWRGERFDVGTMITAIVGLGIAVNGTLHLLTWFCDGLRRGRSRRRAMIEAVVRCGPALWQSSVAVGLGLALLTTSELPLIGRFGGMMSSLIGAALVAHLVLLPAMLAGPLGAVLQRSIPRHSEEDQDRAVSIAPPHIRFRRVTPEVSRPAI